MPAVWNFCCPLSLAVSLKTFQALMILTNWVMKYLQSNNQSQKASRPLQFNPELQILSAVRVILKSYRRSATTQFFKNCCSSTSQSHVLCLLAVLSQFHITAYSMISTFVLSEITGKLLCTPSCHCCCIYV